MIKRLSHVTVHVLDQDSAVDFYTNKLGFEVRTDARLGDVRWVTVGPKTQPELEIILGQIGPPMFSPENAEAMRELVSKGVIGVGVLNVEDCRATYEELSAQGVTFVQEPAERPYGIEAVLRDDSGNWFSLTQRFWEGPGTPSR
jgi:catechol 2,3-dioxygenase-like lactoylglutathione lyase family enzyme